ncbi:MAG: 2-succinyl-6-hydroxy-2,4-cyclohexadiene-1-carboxylate synthase [Salinibacter sp.]
MLHHRTHGAPARPPLCFLHGFMGAGSDWAPVASALETDVYSLTVDLPGHGGSLHGPDHLYCMEGTTQALADVLDDAGIDRCTLVGYSMGGRAALYFALFHPDRVHRLVLESASPGIEGEEARARRRAIDAERARRIREDLDAFLREWYRMPLFASLRRHELVEDMVARRRRNDPDELARALRGLGPGRQPPLWDRLTDLEAPTLLLTGALDEKYADTMAQAHTRIPNARRVLVPKAGHNVHAERPRAFLSHLVDFLRTTTPAP